MADTKPLTTAERADIIRAINKLKRDVEADKPGIADRKQQILESISRGEQIIAADDALRNSTPKPSPSTNAEIPSIYPRDRASETVNYSPMRSKIPLDTTGRPSAYGHATYGTQDFDSLLKIKDIPSPSYIEQMRLQSTKPIDSREGLPGLAATIKPTVVARSDEGSYSRPVVENPIPYTFRLLNIPSAIAGSLIETAGELAVGTPDTTSNTILPDELIKNFTQQVGKGEGISSALGKVGQYIENKVGKATVGSAVEAIRPRLTETLIKNGQSPKEASATVDRLITAGDFIGIDPSKLGKVYGFGGDIAMPSLPEGIALGSQTAKGLAGKVLPEAPKVIDRTNEPVLDIVEEIIPTPITNKPAHYDAIRGIRNQYDANYQQLERQINKVDSQLQAASDKKQSLINERTNLSHKYDSEKPEITETDKQSLQVVLGYADRLQADDFIAAPNPAYIKPEHIDIVINYINHNLAQPDIQMREIFLLKNQKSILEKNKETLAKKLSEFNQWEQSSKELPIQLRQISEQINQTDNAAKQLEAEKVRLTEEAKVASAAIDALDTQLDEMNDIKTFNLPRNVEQSVQRDGGPLYSASVRFKADADLPRDYSGFMTKYHDMLKKMEREQVLLGSINISNFLTKEQAQRLQLLKKAVKLGNDLMLNKLAPFRLGEQSNLTIPASKLVEFHRLSRELDTLIRELDYPIPRAIVTGADDTEGVIYTINEPTKDLFGPKLKVYQVNQYPSEGRFTQREWSISKSGTPYPHQEMPVEHGLIDTHLTSPSLRKSIEEATPYTEEIKGLKTSIERVKEEIAATDNQLTNTINTAKTLLGSKSMPDTPIDIWLQFNELNLKSTTNISDEVASLRALAETALPATKLELITLANRLELYGERYLDEKALSSVYDNIWDKLADNIKQQTHNKAKLGALETQLDDLNVKAKTKLDDAAYTIDLQGKLDDIGYAGKSIKAETTNTSKQKLIEDNLQQAIKDITPAKDSSFYQDAFYDLSTSVLSRLKKKDEPLSQLTSYQKKLIDNWSHNIAAIPERWKYWLRKSKQDDSFLIKAFDEIQPTKEQRQSALASSIIDAINKDQDSLAIKEGLFDFINYKAHIFTRTTSNLSAEVKDRLIWSWLYDNLQVDNLTAATTAIHAQLRKLIPDHEIVNGQAIQIPARANSLLQWLDEAKQEVVPSLYYNLVVEKSSDELISALNKLDIKELISHKQLLAINSFKNRPLPKPISEEVLGEIVTTTLDRNKVDGGLRDFLEAIGVRSGLVGQAQAEYVIGLANQGIGNSLVEAIVNHQSIADIQAVLKLIITPTSRNRLAKLLASSPELSRVVSETPESLKRGQYIVDVLFQKAHSASKQDRDIATQLIYRISDYVNMYANIAKSSLLGGGLVPVPIYHAINAATAPFIIYSKLGGKAALSSLANFPDAARLVKQIYSEKPSLFTGSIDTPNGPISKEAVIKLFQDNNLQSSQIKYEINSDTIEEMRKYIDSSRLTRRLNLKDLVGGNGPNFWNEFASALDSTYKMSVLLSSLKQGDNAVTAINKARNALFDYSALSPIEKKSISKAIWFYSFWRHNLVATLDLMVKPQGWTRIKNLLMVQQAGSNPDSQYEFTLDKPYLGRSLNNNYDLFGPGIPLADAVDELSTTVATLYFLGTMPGHAIETTANFPFRKLASNKLVSLPARGFGLDLSRPMGGTVGPYPDAELVSIMEASPSILSRNNEQAYGLAAEIFGLEWDTKKQRYKFGSREGRAAYVLFMEGIGDVITGRGGQELIKLYGTGALHDKTSYGNLSLIERIAGFTGAARPYKKVYLQDTVNYSNSDIKE